MKTNQQLSKMNGRLYRQTRNYKVSFSMVMENVSASSTHTYSFYTLPNTWFVHGAIRYAYAVYMQAHQDEMNAGIKFARWHDFEINEQDPDGTYDFLNVALFDGDGWAALTADETVSDSTVIDSAGTAKGFNLLGTETNQFNIFNQYAKKLNYQHPTDDAVASSQPYELLLDLRDADDMAEKGDQAPYDRDWSTFLHSGGEDQNILVFQDSLFCDLNGAATRISTRQFHAPLGLVFIRKEVEGTDTDLSTTLPELCLHVAPGSYKGVNAESMV